VVAVVPGDAVLVDVEADAPVGVAPGFQVRGADPDVVDAGENGGVRGEAGVTRRSDSGSCDQRELVGMADGFDGQIHIEVGPVEVVRLGTFDVRELRDRSVLEPGTVPPPRASARSRESIRLSPCPPQFNVSV